MAKVQLSNVISHWHYTLPDFEYSPKTFYGQLEAVIAAHKIPDVHVNQIELREGGVLSAKRTYLRIRRKQHVFDICGAPFGQDFFISWWLSALPQGCLAIMLITPFLNRLVWLLAPPETYFKLDTATMFQTSVHNAVLEVMDGMAQAHGARGVPESERKPVMKEFYQSRVGL